MINGNEHRMRDSNHSPLFTSAHKDPLILSVKEGSLIFDSDHNILNHRRFEHLVAVICASHRYTASHLCICAICVFNSMLDRLLALVLNNEVPPGMLENDALNEIDRKYNKPIAQAILRWLATCIPKFGGKKQTQEPLNVSNVRLSSEDMEASAALDAGKSSCVARAEPEGIKMLCRLKR